MPLGFYHVTLGETLIATGDASGARAAFEAALAARPDLPAALVGLAKLDAAAGDASAAIARLDTAIAAIPLPDSLARRADLLAIRGGAGDARRAEADRSTVEAIAQLAGEAGSVYDRGLSLYLSDHALEPARAVALARDELVVRRDVYGYDALAWALFNAGDPVAADAPMASALAVGTRDARLWVHAGPDRAGQRAGRRGRGLPPARAGARSGPRSGRARARDRRPGGAPMRGPIRAALRGTVLAAALVPIVAGVALAHPLGNFTINHYAGIRVEPERVLLDVVIDEAEIPTFQASQAFDLDGDGALSAAETTAARQSGCVGVGRDLRLAVDGSSPRLLLVEAGLTFPAGNGGLSTMRLACTFEAPLATPVGAGAAITFEDPSRRPASAGARSRVVGSGVVVEAPGIPTTSVSGRLTAYPGGLAAAPSVRSVSFTASPAARRSRSWTCRTPIRSARSTWPRAPRPPRAPTGRHRWSRRRPPSLPRPLPSPASAASTSTSAAVPGGEGSIPDALRSAPATPLIALVALLTAAALGAGHALTPGHGKTLMAAYLVGTRGTPRHAVGLGLAVSVSHTLGILGLAAVVLAAESTLPPDLVVRIAPLVAAVSIVVIGGWMLLTEVRRGLAARRAHGHAAGHGHDHDHGHDHGHEHGPADAHERGHGSEHAHDAGHEHGTVPAPDDGLEHSPRRRPPSPRPGGRLHDQLAQPVRPRARGRPRPVGQRAAHPAGHDRRRPPRVGRDPGRGLRPRDGRGHDRRRAGVRPRTRRCSSGRPRGSARRGPSRLVPLGPPPSCWRSASSSRRRRSRSSASGDAAVTRTKPLGSST